MPEYLKEIERLKINRYKQVIAASKCARAINARSGEHRSHWQAEGSQEEKKDIPPPSKVADCALRSLIDGDIECCDEETKEG